MDRQEDSQAYVRVVATLLALAAIAASTGALPARNRIVLLAVLRHAAFVACTFAARIHAPHFHAQPDRRLWPAPGDDEPVELAEIFRALACALAVPARAAIRAARWLAHQTFGLIGESPAAGFALRPHLAGLAEKPRFADTS